MKMKLFFSACFFSLSLLLFAQNNSIPVNVTKSFGQKYPGISGVQWQNHLTFYKAVFSLNNQSAKACFTPQGQWQKTEISSSYSSLSAPILDGFKKSQYAAWPVLKVEGLDKPGQGLLYIILVKSSETELRKLYFSIEGRMVLDEITL